ncbi:MAG: hypothetical protein IJK84_02665 [Bacteroidales bacterium]|nr:hypothetical protein [Bacteroidales bacterium]
MKKTLILLFILSSIAAMAQVPRPDAFPPLPDTLAPKAVTMATTLQQMDDWDRYPTYEVYTAMMQRFVDSFPQLCHIDTIGTSLQGRLILSLAITGSSLSDVYRPEFFYSSTMHGDEVTGFYLMLRLCDTLLRSYGTSADITNLLDRTRISINPLSNPDGTYHGGNHTVAHAWRYNANTVDLNRNYPDPFGTPPLDPLQQENEAMIDYVARHQFRLAANLHGGSEVMNYPWDSYTSSQQPNEHSNWWIQVCKRFVDTCRRVDAQRFRSVNNNGYIAGGDWYVIHNGRQDFFNYYHNIRELTMELSNSKTLSSDRLNHYWQCQSHALINYIKEIHNLYDTSTVGITPQPLPPTSPMHVYPNPTTGTVTVEGSFGSYRYDLSDRPAGVYILNVEGRPVKVVKH